MADVEMALDLFVFSIATAAYQTFTRSSRYRWQSQERLLRRPAQQFLGIGEETISLDGVIYPEFRQAGLYQIDDMRRLASRGEPLDMVDGYGNIIGVWVIESIEETHAIIGEHGIPLKQTFRMALKHYGEDQA